MKTIADYTEEEFVKFIEAIGNADPALYPTDRAHTNGILEFERLAEHPLGSDLLFYPSRHGIEDSPEAMVKVVKQWRADNGLPGFKNA
ncbi:bacteriocin immunity protein [Pseudomonas putida]|uniref:bacteriocin immunity protein n=1 Tax=Pseudomonas putida TaxID=303 RepID=UPI003D0039C5